ncbi:kazal-type proteinase inhibitor 1 (macronuclear) [Tetrahymena thermophila SB210]|uniref:Kazal-type proteinase inhibitor 1 n=1 Tax=Tetrahymena thermophila (strain SB210) TaxID=312017 RepID=Q23A93_TETTS|nr:kazal-type proteinase inhibitor 1 [Tetrahymena thermophila SB210]EAR93387.1 kazal-type proteinase inhibitor 1 [Tetrahymena thermophila SB210]|eukprot:XP_001013632.1 kazal-type proteinase inhibitor 1 [Tetrahymena thermophila SB210]
MQLLIIFSAIFCLAAAQLIQECPADGRMVKCATNSAQVCGIKGNGKLIKHTFINHCIACQIGKVDFTVSGKCEDYHPEANFCSPAENRVENCTNDVDISCAYFNKNIKCFVPPCTIQIENRCQACVSPNILYTIQGNCKNNI